MHPKLFYNFLMLFMIVPFVGSAQEGRMQDSLALVYLYNATNGPEWTYERDSFLIGPSLYDHIANSTGLWNTGLPIDQWRGITLNEDGRVINISIPYTNLEGFLPDLNLPFLIKLHIGNNELEGNLQDLTFLENLEYLDLEWNDFNGPIPDFSHLPNLKILDLNANRFSGDLPNFSQIPQLEYLLIGSNSFKNEIPNFQNLPKLKEFICSGNKFEGNIPDLLNCPNLEALSFSYNELSGPIPEFDHLTKLRNFFNWYNFNVGPIPSFENSPLLEEVSIIHNQVSGPIPDFDNNPLLEKLNLNNNRLNATIPPFLNNPDLVVIDLSFNELEGLLPAFDHLNLTTLRLNDNNLTGPIPESYDRMVFWLRLQNNDLSGCFRPGTTQCIKGFQEEDFDQGYNFSNNPKMPNFGNGSTFCDYEDFTNLPCDDGNPLSTNDRIREDCSCAGDIPIEDFDNDGFAAEDDCNDTNAFINPGAIEIPFNEIDDNCDGFDYFSFYPNPTNGLINANLPKNSGLTYALRNVTGQIVYQADLEDTIDLLHFPYGLYFIEVYDVDDTLIQISKIVKSPG